jgi:deazaflavin-dependent oxidoreductase (nitroreductase family)
VRGVATRPNYRKPDWFTRNVFNRAVAGLTRLGISVAGSRVLDVPGRKSGKPRRTPVNLLQFDGNRYLVAPRGNTQWVRNLRVAGGGNLLLGRRSEPFRAIEVPDAEKEPILREYLRRWKWEVGQFFDGVAADSSVGELARIAPDHPIFRIESEPPGHVDPRESVV